MIRELIILLLFAVSPFLFADDILPELAEIMDFPVLAYLESIDEFNADSARLNTLGFNAYKENNLLKAAKLWYCSVCLDETNSWAHYNYACALALFVERYGRDPADINYELEWSSEIELIFNYINYTFDHLKQAVNLNSAVRERMQEDSDFDIIRNLDEYKYMLLYPDYDYMYLLNYIGTFYGSNIGVYPTGYADIDGNRIIITQYGFDENDNYIEKTLEGYIENEGTMVTITIIDADREPMYGEIILYKDDYGYLIGLALTIDGVFYSQTPDYGA